MSKKELILSLRQQGKTYKEIAKIVKCGKSLVSYYINPDVKDKKNDKQNKNRHATKIRFKLLKGGRCEICGYNRCLDALDFHHRDPSKKKYDISSMIWDKHRVTEKEILEELSKCVQVCANCHREIHASLISLTGATDYEI